MKQIPLNNSLLITLVDDEFYEHLNQFRWNLSPEGYVCRWRNVQRNYEMMHREVAKLAKWILVKGKTRIDHINQNKIDNQLLNLRTCTQSQNGANSNGTKRNTSGYKGVFARSRGGWWAGIRVNYKLMFLGNFSVKEEAAQAYNEAAKLHFGEFACLNKI